MNLQLMLGLWSGQTQQTVNLSAFAFVGSNPTPSTKKKTRWFIVFFSFDRTDKLILSKYREQCRATTLRRVVVGESVLAHFRQKVVLQPYYVVLRQDPLDHYGDTRRRV